MQRNDSVSSEMSTLSDGDALSTTSSMSGNGGNTPKHRNYHVRKSNLIGMVNWTHVITTYIPHLFVLGIAILISLVFHQVITDIMNQRHISQVDLSLEFLRDIFYALQHLLTQQIQLILNFRKMQETIFSPAVEITFLILIILLWVVKMDNPTYLLSFATFKPPPSWKVSQSQIIQMMKFQNVFTEDSIQFMERLLERSGTGQSTAWPPGIVQCLHGEKADFSIKASRKEAEIIIFDVVENALRQANVSPKEIDVLVINCSLFSPTPSLCAMVISRFGMKSDILSYNLSGMGCGASLLALDLAKNMLQRKSGSGGKALVVSTEIITPNMYLGNERGFLLQNTLFRCGGAAMVLSNKWLDGSRAWFKLLNTVRVQGTTEEAYQCVYETEDECGIRGVRLSKDIVKVAGKTMEKNMTMLGPYVLPWSEQAKVVINIVVRFISKMLNNMLGTKKIPSPRIFVPDFKRGIDHFCIHAGGRAVIDGIEKNMKLEEFHTEPSRMTLLNYGNTSSSSIWYELEYIMHTQTSNPLKKGDRVMQVAFGSGFKCTSAVWLKL
jgi:3-ketoacyl-CoA synthase